MKNADMDYIHVPVLLNEVIEGLNIQSNHNYIDATLGAGGHSEQILERNGPNGKVLGFDLDEQAFDRAHDRLNKFGDRFDSYHGSYVEMKQAIEEKTFSSVNGIVFDLGMSSIQLAVSNRGFSFLKDEPLDMRFGAGITDLTAQTIINTHPEKELVRIFKEFGEERYAKKIAKNICEIRSEKPFKTTQQLVEIIKKSIPFKQSVRTTHYATKVFQALRIVTNDEFNNISSALYSAIDVLEPGGRCAVITFHSLEDKLVKKIFKDLAQGCVCPPNFPHCVCENIPQVKWINKRVIVPTEQEVSENPRSRSAKLRIVEKL